MLWKRINVNAPEVGYLVVKNVSGGTLTGGYPCSFDLSASVDGVRVTQPATANLQAFAGVADADIADDANGLIQIYGYRSSAYIYSSVGSSAAGDSLDITNGEWGMTPLAEPDATKKSFAFLVEAVSSSSSSQYHTTASVFIRAL